MKRRIASIVVAVGLMSAAMPAHAATGTLPDTDSIYIINHCYGSGNDFQLYSVSSTDATLSEVGTGWSGTRNGDCASNTVRHALTGEFYTIGWTDFDTSDPTYNYGFGIVDPSTGTVDRGAGFSYNGDDEWSSIADLCAGPDGTIYGLGNWELYTIDTETGEATMLGTFTNAPHNHSGCAYNDVDGQFYVSSSGTNTLYTMDVDTLTFTEVGPLPATATGFDFDSDGNLWVQGGGHLWTGALDDLGSLIDKGEMTLSGSSHPTQGLFVVKPWEAPMIDDTTVEKSTNEPLAETGFDAQGALGLAALAVVGGIALVLRRRRV